MKKTTKQKRTAKRAEKQCDCDLCRANAIAVEMFLVIAKHNAKPKVALMAAARLPGIILETFPEEADAIISSMALNLIVQEDAQPKGEMH